MFCNSNWVIMHIITVKNRNKHVTKAFHQHNKDVFMASLQILKICDDEMNLYVALHYYRLLQIVFGLVKQENSK